MLEKLKEEVYKANMDLPKYGLVTAEFTSEETLTDSNDNFTDSSSGKLFGRTSSDSSETSPGGPALSTDISPEASEGSWASSGSNWMFLVDDKPYTGWFTDTDGKQYYMDETCWRKSLQI